VRAGVREARERGVLFDLGHGFGSFTFDVARRAMDDGFLPDTISTDLYADNMVTPVKDLLTTASKFLCLGLPLDDVLARVTCRPAQALRIPDLGALRVGGPADVALLRLCEGEYVYQDCREGTLQGRYKLECDLTVCRGRILYERGER
jgi:dihydroorotase